MKLTGTLSYILSCAVCNPQSYGSHKDFNYEYTYVCGCEKILKTTGEPRILTERLELELHD